MAERNLYVVLGVSGGESEAGIRAAYLELAKRHPDLAGGDERAAFEEIAEAYRVLSDPALRRRHDERLRRLEPRPAESRPPARRSEGAHPEPLRPEPLRVMGDPEAIHPSFAEVYDRLLRNFTRVGVPKAERVEPLAFDLVLTPEEAARGGVLPVDVPAFARCPACDGSGQEWTFTCLRCDGQGLVEDERTVGVRIPPLTEEHTVIEVPLEGLGISNLRLRLHVRIGV